MAAKNSDKQDLQQALIDPASVFKEPEEVLDNSALDREQKIEILKRWEYDASELEVAEEEGMGGGEQPLLQRILATLEKLTGEIDVEHSPPTKQGGI